MTDKVVKIGMAVGKPDADQPIADIVADLERLLAMAKSGRMTGFAYATVEANVGTWPTLASGWSGWSTRNEIGMAIMMLAHRYPASVFAEQADK